MAITSLGNNAILFTDSADVLTWKIKIKDIVCITNAAGGNFQLVNEDGNTIWESGTMNANTRTNAGDGCMGWVRGIAFTGFPAGGEVVVYYA